MDGTEILNQNRQSWNSIADDWFGVTALPEYGCRIPAETELNLFGDVRGKKILDIGCGSGHSLLYHGKNGAGELWGLDISSRQLENAERQLSDNGLAARLFCSPMEENPGIPEDYFDVVYSVYAIGWTVDLTKTLKNISCYLKRGGCFIFSWDHPFMSAVGADEAGGRYVLDGGYLDRELFTFKKAEQPVSLYNRRFCDYVNALYETGFVIERIVEETDNVTVNNPAEFSSAYYAAGKAKLIPLSFIMKARKL